MSAERSEAPRHLDTFANPEKMLPQVDCFVVLGRGIEKVLTAGGEVWKPTRYVVELVQKQKPETGFTHTARRKPLSSDSTQGPHKLIVGGGNANTLASVQYLHEMQECGTMPRVFIQKFICVASNEKNGK